MNFTWRLTCFLHFSRLLCLATECDCEISAIAQNCLNFSQSRIRQWLWTLKPSFALCQRKSSMQWNKPSMLTWILWSPSRWVHWSHLWEASVDTVTFSWAFSLRTYPCISGVNCLLAGRKTVFISGARTTLLFPVTLPVAVWYLQSINVCGLQCSLSRGKYLCWVVTNRLLVAPVVWSDVVSWLEWSQNTIYFLS